jgi:hypothetical protein
MQASTTDVLMAAAIGIIAADCFRLSGQPGRTDVGLGWLRLGACNPFVTRSAEWGHRRGVDFRLELRLR